MTLADQTYSKLLRDILLYGESREDRTGTGTISLFGYQMRFDLQDSFPLITTKKVHTRSVFAELLWMLSGSTNIEPLREQGVTIWDEWADPNGDLGPVYGQQWRSWGNASISGRLDPVDQITEVIEGIKNNPFSRRHIVTAWNPGDIGKMALPPCHMMFQFYVHADSLGQPAELSCQLYQRSGDVFLGVPFNIASYALLTEMVAKACGLKARHFVHTLGDAHIYRNHIDQVHLQLSRDPRSRPTLFLSPGVESVFDYTLGDILISDYNPHPAIKAPVAV